MQFYDAGERRRKKQNRQDEHEWWQLPQLWGVWFTKNKALGMEYISVYAVMESPSRKSKKKKEELWICCYSPYTLKKNLKETAILSGSGVSQQAILRLKRQSTDCSGKQKTIYEKEWVNPVSSSNLHGRDSVLTMIFLRCLRLKCCPC